MKTGMIILLLSVHLFHSIKPGKVIIDFSKLSKEDREYLSHYKYIRIKLH